MRVRASMSECGEYEQDFGQTSYEDGRQSPSRSLPRRQSSPPSPPSVHGRPSASDQTLVLAYKPLREKPVHTCEEERGVNATGLAERLAGNAVLHVVIKVYSSGRDGARSTGQGARGKEHVIRD